MIKAVIFDLDGLLIDSEPIWREAHRRVLLEYGKEPSERDLSGMAGKGTAKVVSEWIGKLNINPLLAKEIENKITELAEEKIKTTAEAHEGVIKLLKEINGHDVPMAIASSSKLELIEAVAERLKFAKYFSGFRSGNQEKRGKPFPDIFLSTAKMLCVNPSECVVFEDSVSGVFSAKSAEMYCVAVPEPPYDLRNFDIADLVVSSLNQVNWSKIRDLSNAPPKSIPNV